MRDDDHLYDLELYSLAKSGDENAFTKLYRRHWQSLFNGAYKRLQCKDQSQDIVQNIFIDFWERRNSLDVGNVQAYLHTAVRFQVFKYTARQPQNARLLHSFEASLAAAGHADDAILEEEILTLLSLWINALPLKGREIFLQHYFEGLSTSEIAARLDIAQKTVQNQLNTATAELRMKFDKILCIDLVAFAIFFQ